MLSSAACSGTYCSAVSRRFCRSTFSLIQAVLAGLSLHQKQCETVYPSNYLTTNDNSARSPFQNSTAATVSMYPVNAYAVPKPGREAAKSEALHDGGLRCLPPRQLLPRHRSTLSYRRKRNRNRPRVCRVWSHPGTRVSPRRTGYAAFLWRAWSEPSVDQRHPERVAVPPDHDIARAPVGSITGRASSFEATHTADTPESRASAPNRAAKRTVAGAARVFGACADCH